MTNKTNTIRLKKGMRINTKEEARQRAIEIQQYISENSLSYSELIEIQTGLYNLGKRVGLIKEFKENGLL